MLSRLASTSIHSNAMAFTMTRVSQTSGVRNYATLKEVELRLKSIKNIEKITKTMKIVASTRLSKAEKAKINAQKIDDADKQFFENAETGQNKTTDETLEGEENASTDSPRELIIAVTSDKGLCGSIHSSLARKVRAYVNENPNCDIVTIGDKMKMQLLRSHPNNLKLSFNGIGKEAPTFEESSLMTSKIIKELNADKNYPKISIYYNDPISSLSFESTRKPVFNPRVIANSPAFSKFEIANDENVPNDLFEYTFTNQILTAMAKGFAAEISARRNAMDNASKNAGDMINRYSILYNRTRQAVITNELVDIITGASSLD